MSTIKFIFLIFCFFFFNSCAVGSQSARFPRESFVKIHTKMTVEFCTESSENLSVCEKSDFYSVGSGAVVWHKNKKTFILTAGHVCHAEVESPLKELTTSVTMKFKVQNIHNKWYDVTVSNISPEYLNGNELDLCILQSDGIISMPKIHLSLTSPKIGEQLYNVAAPTGFFSPPTVPLLSGYYSGPLGKYHSLLTIPATGGSSGSPVLNHRGELVGLIFAAYEGFPHLTISVRYEVLRKYLQENLYP